jgi:hypothetical protein
MMRTFLKVYEKHRKLFPRREGPTTLPQAAYIVDEVMKELEANRRLSIRQEPFVVASDDAAHMIRTLLWMLRHDHGYHFHRENEV